MTDTIPQNETDASLWPIIDRDEDPFDIEFDDVHGLEETVPKLRDQFVNGLVKTDPIVRTPGLVLYGPDGAGKRRVARAVASELAGYGFECVRLATSDLDDRDSHHRGRDDPEIAELVDTLVHHAPVTLLIEGFENLQVDVDGPLHEAVQRVRVSGARVGVVCVLSQRRGGLTPESAPEYFKFADFTVRLDAPTDVRRAHILRTKLDSLTTDTAVSVRADLEDALQTVSKEIDVRLLEDIARRAVLRAQVRSQSLTVGTNDVVAAIRHVVDERTDDGQDLRGRPTGGDTFEPEVASVRFDEIGGLDAVIRELQEILLYPQEYDRFYTNTSLDPTSGVLLYGPPGTGKTRLGTALATETDRRFYAVQGPEVKSKWFGQSEQHIRQLFETAREEAPSLVFFDEFDALAPARQQTGHSAVRSIVNTLLAELDGLTANDDVVVIAATNRPDAIDSAVLRPGRIGQALEIPPPDRHGREAIFEIHTRNVPTADSVTPSWFAEAVPDGITGADIAAIVERAARYAIRVAETDQPSIEKNDIQYAINAVIESGEGSVRGYQ